MKIKWFQWREIHGQFWPSYPPLCNWLPSVPPSPCYLLLPPPGEVKCLFQAVLILISLMHIKAGHFRSLPLFSSSLISGPPAAQTPTLVSLSLCLRGCQKRHLHHSPTRRLWQVQQDHTEEHGSDHVCVRGGWQNVVCKDPCCCSGWQGPPLGTSASKDLHFPPLILLSKCQLHPGWCWVMWPTP